MIYGYKRKEGEGKWQNQLDLQLGLRSTWWSLQLKLRILRESSLEGEKTGSVFDVEFEECVGGTPVERQQQLVPVEEDPGWRQRSDRQAGYKPQRRGEIICTLIRTL